MVCKSTTSTEQLDRCPKHCSQEKRSKNSKGELNWRNTIEDMKQTVECWLMVWRFLITFRFFFLMCEQGCLNLKRWICSLGYKWICFQQQRQQKDWLICVFWIYLSTLLKTEMHLAEKFWASVSMQMNLFLATQLQLPYSLRLLINQKCYLNKSVAHWYILRKHLTQ